MKTKFQQLRLRQLDAALAKWRNATLPLTPATGWVRAVRDALGMSSAALAQRIGVTDSAVRKLEMSEASDAISLGTLRRAAAALDCELKYALVPRKSLESARQERATLLAQQQVAAVAHSMALEDQAVDAHLTQAQVQDIAQSLLLGPSNKLW